MAQWRQIGSLSIAILLAIVAFGGAAWSQECRGSRENPHDIELKVDIPEPRLHHNLGIAELGRKALHGPGRRVLGLADTGLQFGWGVRFEWQARVDTTFETWI